MAVSDTNPVAGPYVGNGVTTVFPFSFSAIEPGDVSVLLRTGSGDTILTAGYVVSLGPSGGGSVTIATPPPIGVAVYIYSDPDFAQDISFVDGGRFLADTVNEVNDRAAVRSIALREQLSRAVMLPLGEAVAALPAPSARLGKVLGFDIITGALTLLDNNLVDGTKLLSALIAVTAGYASAFALSDAMTVVQQQSMRDALASLDEGDRRSRQWNLGGYVQQTDSLGQLIGSALFGNTSDPRLTDLFAAANAASAPPVSYNLIPIALGQVVIP